jgi:uncharacterized protein YuzE
MVNVTWYDEDDAVYIELSDKEFGYGKGLDDERRIDFASDGTPIGVRLLYISDGVEVSDLPEQKAIIDVLESHNIKVFA